MARTKKNILNRKAEKSLKNHPITKNPIVILYAVTIIVIVLGYVIYLIAKQSV